MARYPTPLALCDDPSELVLPLPFALVGALFGPAVFGPFTWAGGFRLGPTGAGGMGPACRGVTSDRRPTPRRSSSGLRAPARSAPPPAAARYPALLMQVSPLRCSSCGAVVDEAAVRRGACDRCGRRSPWHAYLGASGLAGRLLGGYRRTVLVALAGAGLLWAGWLINTFFPYTEGSRYGDEALGAALLIGFAALLLMLARAALPAIAAALAGGVALIAKPLLHPMSTAAGNDGRPFSLTSETHLNFLVPGVVLVGLAALLTLVAARRAAGTARRTADSLYDLGEPR